MSQTTGCPDWCVADHEEEREHRSGSVIVPVVTPSMEAVEFSAQLLMQDADPHPWIHLGDGEGRDLEVSVESGTRIAATLRRLADAATGSGRQR